MKKKILAGLGIATALALTACSTGDGGDTGGDGGLEKVNVAVIPIGDTAAIWLAKNLGYFEDEGLDVNIDTAGGGAAIVPGVTTGDFDFGFSNYVSLYFANEKGLNLRVIANGTTAAEDLEKDFGGVLVQGDSDIQTPADLAGKTVSVNTLSNIGDTTISQIVADDGGDPSTIKFTELGFPDAPAALDAGQVDAIWVVEPFLSQALSNGARLVTYNFNAFDPELDVAGYFTSQKTLDAKPETVEKFRKALNKGLDYANSNPDEVRRILATYTTMTPEVIESIAIPRFRSEVDMGAAEKLAKAAVEFSGLKNDVDFESFFVIN